MRFFVRCQVGILLFIAFQSSLASTWIYNTAQVPLDDALQEFQNQVRALPVPIDEATLYTELQRVEDLQSRLAQLRTTPSVVDDLKSNIQFFMSEEFNLEHPEFCIDTDSAEETRQWAQERITRLARDAARWSERVGAEYQDISVSLPPLAQQETCSTYQGKLITFRDGFRKALEDRLAEYAQIEREKLENIPDVIEIYRLRSEALKAELELARARAGRATATSIAENLWAMVLVLGAIAITILAIVRLFPEKTQLELVQSGQVIQFITVLLLVTVIMSLGLSNLISENTLGTLLGGLAGYVLSQGVGRAATHKAKKDMDEG